MFEEEGAKRKKTRMMVCYSSMRALLELCSLLLG